MAITHEHPFAEFIKILGKGKKGSRSLTQDEAYRAMSMILNDEIRPEQLGAFLMLMRVKEESAEELHGFVQAARDHLASDQNVPGLADLDWSSYAGKRRHLPWFLLSIFLLAQNGMRVFLHGAAGHTEGRLYTEAVLNHLNIPSANSLAQAKAQLDEQHFTYLPLQFISPRLQEIIDLRSIMGLRSPVHTLVRLLNPLNAPYSIQGIFHPSYRAVHQHAAAQLGQAHMAVLKGEGGETERNPDNDCIVQSVHEGELSDEIWPAMFSRRHMKAETLDPQQLVDLWQGTLQDEYAEATVIGTCAIALHLLGKATSQDEALACASTYWHNRNRTRFLPQN